MKDFSQILERNFREKILTLPEDSDFIELQIKLLFHVISGTKNLKEADFYFHLLDEIQTALARAIFKDGVTVSHFIREFVYDFDRIDDMEVRKFQYKKIKSFDLTKLH